jgi:hypothetical protein
VIGAVLIDDPITIKKYSRDSLSHSWRAFDLWAVLGSQLNHIFPKLLSRSDDE